MGGGAEGGIEPILISSIFEFRLSWTLVEWRVEVGVRGGRMRVDGLARYTFLQTIILRYYASP